VTSAAGGAADRGLRRDLSGDDAPQASLPNGVVIEPTLTDSCIVLDGFRLDDVEARSADPEHLDNSLAHLAELVSS
jgi:hypothetical protein